MITIETRRRTKFSGFDVILHLFFIGTSIVFLYPVYYQLIASVSNPGIVSKGYILIYPLGFNLTVYKMMLSFKSVWLGYQNSLINLALFVSCSLATTMGAAYSLSRPNIWGKKVLMIFFIIPMFLQGGLIPMFITVKNFGLYDSRWALVLPYALTIWNMLMARAFLKASITDALYEASIIDGANEFQFFFQIVLPLSKAIMAVLMLYYGAENWNSYFREMIYLRDSSLYPLQLVLRQILLTDASIEVQSDYLWQESVKYAVTVVSVLPLLFLFPFVQRYFVKGVMVGSIKG